jgi:L-ascorbate metabolism protein UlaG (beta-lactamase superfamily)
LEQISMSCRARRLVATLTWERVGDVQLGLGRAVVNSCRTRSARRLDVLGMDARSSCHTHFDHAIDAPAIAKRFGCKAYGSGSLTQLLRLHGRPELAVEVQPHHVYELGPFAVSFTPSLHSKLLLGLAVPMDGELTCDHLDALAPGAYKCGQVYGIHIAVAGMTFYHQGSANLIEEEIRHRDVDVFLAGVAGRGFTPRYWQRILTRLQPRVIVPTHYDDFFKPPSPPSGGRQAAALGGDRAALDAVRG